ncbi:unnamed protein product, partial [Urochloa humidicola]
VPGHGQGAGVPCDADVAVGSGVAQQKPMSCIDD